jgi:hypothetical protein
LWTAALLVPSLDEEGRLKAMAFRVGPGFIPMAASSGLILYRAMEVAQRHGHI